MQVSTGRGAGCPGKPQGCPPHSLADITSFSGQLKQFCMSLLVLYQFPVDLINSFYSQFVCSRALHRFFTQQVSSTITISAPKLIQLSWPFNDSTLSPSILIQSFRFLFHSVQLCEHFKMKPYTTNSDRSFEVFVYSFITRPISNSCHHYLSFFIQFFRFPLRFVQLLNSFNSTLYSTCSDLSING